jgi:hypothetical protein
MRPMIAMTENGKGFGRMRKITSSARAWRMQLSAMSY